MLGPFTTIKNALWAIRRPLAGVIGTYWGVQVGIIDADTAKAVWAAIYTAWVTRR